MERVDIVVMVIIVVVDVNIDNPIWINQKWVHDKFPLNHDTSKYLSSDLTDYTD